MIKILKKYINYKKKYINYKKRDKTDKLKRKNGENGQWRTEMSYEEYSGTDFIFKFNYIKFILYFY